MASVFYYPINVYTALGARSVLAGTTQLLPSSGNEGDCCILFNSKADGLYVWVGSGWLLQIGDQVISAAAIFRRSMRIFIAPQFNQQVLGDLYQNGSKGNQSIVAGPDVWVNIQDAATPGQPTVVPGSINNLPITLGQTGNGIYLETSPSTGMPSPSIVIVREDVQMWIAETGVTVRGNLAARVSTNEPVPLVPQLGVKRLIVIATSDTAGLNVSADGGFTYNLYPPNTLPFDYVIDGGVTNVAEVAIGSSITVQINPGLSTPASSIVVTASSANQGCTIVDTGVSTGNPSVYGVGRTFTITPTAAGCDAVATLTATVNSVVSTMDVHLAIRTS